MKALHDRTQNLQAQSVATDLAARVAGIFELEFYNEIACTLLELMDEQPEAFDFLSGRTFARTMN